MRAVIFDFDGTLADSEVQILSVVDALAEKFGYPPIDPAEVNKLRELSAWQFITKRLHISPWRIAKLLRFEREAKAEFEMRADEIAMVAGMADVVKRLRDIHYIVGIVSTSPATAIRHVLAKHECDVDFVDGRSSAFGKARAIRRVMRQHKLDPAKTLYVGDELRDIAASRKAGIGIVGVAWGLNDEKSLRSKGIDVASTPEELFSMLTARI